MTWEMILWLLLYTFVIWANAHDKKPGSKGISLFVGNTKFLGGDTRLGRGLLATIVFPLIGLIPSLLGFIFEKIGWILMGIGQFLLLPIKNIFI